jgi:purine catabolism regulator
MIRRTHHELILGLLGDPTSPDLLRRCELAGLPTAGRQLVGVTLRPRIVSASSTADPGSLLDEVIAATVHATHQAKVPALVCEVERDVRALLSFARSANPDRVVDEVAAKVRGRLPVVVAVGRPVTRTGEIDRTLREAQHVVASLRPDSTRDAVVRLQDVHLRGLLAILSGDDRVAMFVERELGALRAHDAEWDTALLDAVRALLNNPTSKSDAAASLHVSRPVFYDRLSKAERVLGVSLDDPDIRVSLHVALVAEEVGHTA